MIHSLIILAPFLIASVHAANDWSQPCLQGVCSYDVGGQTGSPSGTMKIWGANDAISDVTTAAGWMILGCDANATSQDIRLVCTNEAAGCSHLYQNGAENTLVRLPENCGKSPFARVAKAYVPADQSIPASMTANVSKTNGSSPQVKALSLDTNWSAASASGKGNVSIAIQGSSLSGQTGDIDISAVAPQRRSRLASRGLGSIIDDAKQKLSNLDSFNKTLQTTAPPININKDFPLISSSLDCADFSVSLNADVNPSLDATVTFGVAAAGTIVPPKISNFMLFIDLNADLNAALNVHASATGNLDSGVVTLLPPLGIPGLDIPDILTIGPSFTITGEITSTADVEVDMTVNLAYKITDAKLMFPPSSGPSSGTFAPLDSPLKLSVSPSVTATGSIAVHLTPTVDVGISALGKTASADVFLNLDASATLNLNLDGQANATDSISVGKGSDNMTKTGQASQMMGTHTMSTNTSMSTMSAKPNSTMSMSTKPMSTKPAGMMGTRSQNPVTSSSFDGCIELDGALSVNAGASGSFFDIFNDSDQVTLFEKDFQLFQKCFGNAATPAVRRRSRLDRFPHNIHASKALAPLRAHRVSARKSVSKLEKRISLTCPGSALPAAVPAADETITGASEATVTAKSKATATAKGKKAT